MRDEALWHSGLPHYNHGYFDTTVSVVSPKTLRVQSYETQEPPENRRPF